MFDQLTQKLSHAIQSLIPDKKLKEEHIKGSLKEVRNALIEADVALNVVKDFIHEVQHKVVGGVIPSHLSPAQYFIQVLHQELVVILGGTQAGLNLKTNPPACILLVGLQGSGKTTTDVKLAKWIQDTLKKSVLVVSTDTFRPAAITQLQQFAEKYQVPFLGSSSDETPQQIAERALVEAKKRGTEVLLVDTAGRLHIDDVLMKELGALHKILNPIESLLVVDSMMGKEAAKTALAFKSALPLTGVILTKTDSDTRGGAALSIKYVSEVPVKFVGVGEDGTALEAFYPEGFASRILGMGDVLSLVETLERKVDKEKAEKLAKKLEKGKGFDLEDLRSQFREVQNIGISTLLGKLPGMGGMTQVIKDKVNDNMMVSKIALLDSMTAQERRYPNIILQSGSRRRRITEGSGTQPQDLQRLMKEYEQMQKMMKKLTNKQGFAKMMQGMASKFPSTDLPK